MGRANRQSHAGDTRVHWTEEHPDRDLWTPEQEALARTMSEAAYTALYGRGEPVERVDLEEDRLRAQRAKRVEALRSMTSSAVLDELDGSMELSEEVDLHVGATLQNPDANNREYRVRIILYRADNGHHLLKALTEWGPSGRVGSQGKVVYTGKNLVVAAEKCNEMIDKKEAKGYRPPLGESARVSSQTAHESLVEIATEQKD